jgi:hypothetical protein
MEDLKADLDDFCAKGAEKAFKELDLVDLNSAIYRADGEERDAGELASSQSPSCRPLIPPSLSQSAAMESTPFPGCRLSSTAVFRDGCTLSPTS